MARKDDLKAELSALLEKKSNKPHSEHKASKDTNHKRAGRNSRIEEIKGNDFRTSLVVDKSLYNQICQIAVANGLNYKDVLNAAMRLYIEKYEKKHGPITPRESNISADDLI